MKSFYYSVVGVRTIVPRKIASRLGLGFGLGLRLGLEGNFSRGQLSQKRFRGKGKPIRNNVFVEVKIRYSFQLPRENKFTIPSRRLYFSLLNSTRSTFMGIITEFCYFFITLTYVPLDEQISFYRKQFSPLFSKTVTLHFSALYFPKCLCLEYVQY